MDRINQLLLAIMTVSMMVSSTMLVPTPNTAQISEIQGAADEPSPGMMPIAWASHTFQANISHWKVQIKSGESIPILLGDGNSINLSFNGEHQEREIWHGASNGSLSMASADYKYFNVEDGGRARIVFGKESIRGLICMDPPDELGSSLHNIISLDNHDFPQVQLKILSRTNTLDCPTSLNGPSSITSSSSTGYPYDPPEPDVERDVVPDVHLEGVLAGFLVR